MNSVSPKALPACLGRQGLSIVTKKVTHKTQFLGEDRLYKGFTSFKVYINHLNF